MPNGPVLVRQFSGEELGLSGEKKAKDPSQCEECLKPIIKWLSEWGYDLFAALISIADVTTDIIVMRQYYLKGHFTFFYLSLTIVLIAQLCYSLAFAVKYTRYNDPFSKRICVFFAVLPISPLLGFVFFWASIPGNSLIHWMQENFDLRKRIYNPDRHPQDSTLKKWVNTKFQKHMGFILEAGIEAFPQSLLQMTALVYYGDGQVSGVAIASILLSLLSVCSKSLVFSQALVPSLFLFNWLCLVSDFIGVFTVISWVFAPASGDPSPLLSASLWPFGSFSTLGQLYLLHFFLMILPMVIVVALFISIIPICELYQDSTSEEFRSKSLMYQAPSIVMFGCLSVLIFSIAVCLGSILLCVPCTSGIAMMIYLLNHERFDRFFIEGWIGIFDFLSESTIPNAFWTKLKVLCMVFFGGCKDDIPELKDLRIRTAVANLFLSSVRCGKSPLIHQHLHSVFLSSEINNISVMPPIILSTTVSYPIRQHHRFDYNYSDMKCERKYIDGNEVLHLNALSAVDPAHNQRLYEETSFSKIRKVINDSDNDSESDDHNSTLCRTISYRCFAGERQASNAVNRARFNHNPLNIIDVMSLWINRANVYCSMPLWVVSRVFHGLFPLICLIQAMMATINKPGTSSLFASDLALQSCLSVLYVTLQIVVWMLFFCSVLWFQYLTWHLLPSKRVGYIYFGEAGKHQSKVVSDIRDFYNIVVLRPIQERALYEQLGSDVASVVLEYLPVDFAKHRWLLYCTPQDLELYQPRVKFNLREQRR